MDKQWRHMRLLNKDEVKYCIKKILENEPFTTKKYMIGKLHHITAHRFMRHFNAEHPIVDREYKLVGIKEVNEHNEKMIKALTREGFIKYEKHRGSYKYKGKAYNHFIIKINE
ncbi:hypothetical protein U8V72_20125 [Priestia filamentosa]|uniref:hypothetical protein n=1 Tax=Priestia filamentosa TaxID=1402861 RepID=UPI00397A172C